GVFVMGATTCCDGGFTGGGVGSYELGIQSFAVVHSISGRIVDAVTRLPLSGTSEPFATVRLLHCDAPGCFDVNSSGADAEGRFRFERDASGQPLEAGTYQIIASANEYHDGQPPPFPAGDGEEVNVGDVPLEPFPVRVSEIRPCGALPPEGGTCRY